MSVTTCTKKLLIQMRLQSCVLLLQLALLVHSATALSVVRSLFSEQGVSSIIRGRSKKIFAGTKRGHLLILEKPSLGASFEITSSQQIDSKTFPIYSLASTRDYLFCGCGDRYVSTLNSAGENNQEQRLGPHTGWVKAIYYDETSELLFTIGCNCIETWARTAERSWEHCKKRSIESSPTVGATLSSDLLCLCGSATNDDCFYSGGVDGRIHVWSVDPSIKQPLTSIGAHTGRLNCLLYDSNLLFSAGNDGILQCRRAGQQLEEPIATVDLGEEFRITAGSLLKSSESSMDLVLGCSNGIVKHFLVVFDKNDVSICEQGELMIAVDSSIKALLLVPDQSGTPSALVGHSAGLSLVTL